MWRLAAAYAVVEAAQEGDVRLAGDAVHAPGRSCPIWEWLMAQMPYLW